MLVKIMRNHFSHWHILVSIVVGPSRTVRILQNGNSQCSELANMALGRQTQVGEGDLLWNKVLGKVISRKWHFNWDLKENKLLINWGWEEKFSSSKHGKNLACSRNGQKVSVWQHCEPSWESHRMRLERQAVQIFPSGSVLTEQPL